MTDDHFAGEWHAPRPVMFVWAPPGGMRITIPEHGCATREQHEAWLRDEERKRREATAEEGRALLAELQADYDRWLGQR